jgi:hypothetical protein
MDPTEHRLPDQPGVITAERHLAGRASGAPTMIAPSFLFLSSRARLRRAELGHPASSAHERRREDRSSSVPDSRASSAKTRTSAASLKANGADSTSS